MIITKVIEDHLAPDFNYLQDLDRRINGFDQSSSVSNV